MAFLMGNHTIDCEVCGEDLSGLGGGHAKGCPGETASELERNLFRNYGYIPDPCQGRRA